MQRLGPSFEMLVVPQVNGFKFYETHWFQFQNESGPSF
jgi:hypothetical protein